MQRTLYLNENERGLIVMRDGPSVLIRDRFHAPRRIPVRLLSKVIVIGNVRLDAGSIMLFADNNLPVVFMNKKGEEVAVVIPYNHRLAGHYEEQKSLLETEIGIQRYTKWANTRRMKHQLDVLKRLFKKGPFSFLNDIGEGNYQLIINKLKPEEEKWCVVANIVTNLFRGLIIEKLLKADLDPHTGVIHRRHNFGLALDICYILGAEADMQSLQFFRLEQKNIEYMIKKSGGLEITESGMRDIIQRFENRKSALSMMVESIIDEIFELIREVRT
jgi:CRISPR/Cas system-associated endonuclease Cas1